MFEVPKSRPARLVIVSDPNSSPEQIDAVIQFDQNPAVLRAAIKNSATAEVTLRFIYDWTRDGELVSLRNGSDFSLLRDQNGRESLGYIKYKILNNLIMDSYTLTQDFARLLALDERDAFSIAILLRRELMREQDAVDVLKMRDDCATYLSLDCVKLPELVNDALFQMMVELSETEDETELLSPYGHDVPELRFTRNADLSPFAKRIKSIKLANALWAVPSLPQAQREIIASTWPSIVRPVVQPTHSRDEQGRVLLSRQVDEFPEYEGGQLKPPLSALDDEELIENERQLRSNFSKFVKRWGPSDFFWPFFSFSSPFESQSFDFDALVPVLNSNKFYRSIVARRVRDLPIDVLNSLTTDADAFVRFNVAGRINLPPEICTVLANDGVEPVRAQVALHQPGLELTKIFLEDPSKIIQSIARQRRPLTFELFEYYKDKPIDIDLDLNTIPQVYGATADEWLDLIRDADSNLIYSLGLIINESTDSTTAPAREYLLRYYELGNLSRLSDISDYTTLSLAGCADSSIRRAILKSLFGHDITLAKLPGLFRSLPQDDQRLAPMLASTSDQNLLNLAESVRSSWVRAGVIYNWKSIDQARKLEGKFTRNDELNQLGWQLFDERKERIERLASFDSEDHI